MKTLILFYSRTGTTRKVAVKISEINGWPMEEIVDTKDRSGAIGYLLAGRDATMRKFTEIKPLTNNLADFDLVVIGTPIWSWNVSTPIRTFLDKYKNELKQVAFFSTMGGSGSERAFGEMEAICGKKSKGTLVLTTKEVIQNNFQDKLNNFITRLNK